MFVERVSDGEVALGDLGIADPTGVVVVVGHLVDDDRLGVGELHATAADGTLPGGHVPVVIP